MRGPAAVLVIALALGFAAGLTLSWVVVPGRAPDTLPHSLRPDYKDQVREAVAAAYAATGNLGRARARLLLLRDTDAIDALTGQAQRALAAGQPFETAQELARLASDLQAGNSSVAPRATELPAESATEPLSPAAIAPSTTPPVALQGGTGSPTLFPTPSPIPSTTPMPSPSGPFRLVSRDELCDPNVAAGVLQVNVQDSQGRPLPGIEISVTWDQGTDRFFTGLQPEISLGYADYTMKAGTTYALQVARMGVPVSGLTPPTCTPAADKSLTGGLQLTFAAP